MRIVVLLGNYVPKASAVGICMKNIVDCLKDGNDVTVICLRQTDEQLEEECLEDTTIVRVSTPLRRMRYRADNHIAGGGSPLAKIGRLYTKVARLGRLTFRKTALDTALVKAYYKALLELDFQPDILIPACLPFEAVQAAADYRADHPGTRLVPYLFDQFSDSATLYPFRFLAKSKRTANLSIEKRAFELSDKVLNITWQEHVESCYPELSDKFVHVEHPLLVRPKKPIVQQGRSDKRILLYAGALTRGVRSPEYALAVLDRALGLGAQFDFADFYTPGADASAEWFKPYTPSGRIRLNDAVPASEVGELYSRATWLLSIGNTVLGQKVSKVYEYMGFGKPIVHFSCLDGDETAGELNDYPLAIVLKQSDPIEVSARRLCTFLSETACQSVPFDMVARLFKEELPSHIAMEILGGSPYSDTV